MAQLLRSNDPKGPNIFDLPELLEQILYYLEIDRSLIPLCLSTTFGITAVLLFYGVALSFLQKKIIGEVHMVERYLELLLGN